MVPTWPGLILLRQMRPSCTSLSPKLVSARTLNITELPADGGLLWLRLELQVKNRFWLESHADLQKKNGVYVNSCPCLLTLWGEALTLSSEFSELSQCTRYLACHLLSIRTLSTLPNSALSCSVLSFLECSCTLFKCSFSWIRPLYSALFRFANRTRLPVDC